jgi:hypothetical protein
MGHHQIDLGLQLEVLALRIGKLYIALQIFSNLSVTLGNHTVHTARSVLDSNMYIKIVCITL